MKGGKVKKGPRTLGRKGLRKYRATNNYTWPGEESNEYPGGQAQLLRKLADEGFGIGTDDFPKNFVAQSCCARIKTARFVLPAAVTYKNKPKTQVVSWNIFKLASTCQQEESDTARACLNPFMDAMPFGSLEPLPRQDKRASIDTIHLHLINSRLSPTSTAGLMYFKKR